MVAQDRPISPLILAELYESGDRAFVDRLVEQLAAQRGDLRNLRPLVALIERWKKDNISRAREMKLAFVLDDRLTVHHRLPFKRLFKQAWHDRDHELMGAFLYRMDRSIRRQRTSRYRYIDRTYARAEVLWLYPDGLRTLFSPNTTHYMRRRAWRYFRRLGFREPPAYVGAVSKALVRYTDDDVRLGENLLDNWGLMHACFGKSDVLTFQGRHTNIRPQRRLAELSAAPMFERLWAEPTAANDLLGLLVDANCRPVRVWAIQLLKRHHAKALSSVDAGLLLRLIDHADADVAAFAAELLADPAVAGTLPVKTWMRLLATRNATVVSAVADAFRKHVRFDRVTLAEAVEIALNAAAPVARLGLEIARGRPMRSQADRDAVARLAGARCAALGEEIGRFAVPTLNAPGAYRRDAMVAFFDSPLASLRAGAFAALEDPSPAATDPAFWAAVFESPYDDVRANLVKRLDRRQSLPGVGGDALDRLWRGVLLNVHRGGRAKLSALKLISRQVADDAGSAGALLPILAVALRSVRAPEARHGLAAVVWAVEHRPELAADVARFLPELQLDPADPANAAGGAGASGGGR